MSKESPAGARLCLNHDSTRPRRTAALKGKRDALTAELAETDPKLGDQLFDILTRIKAVDEEIARLGGAPDGSGGVPHVGGAGIAKELRLPGFGAAAGSGPRRGRLTRPGSHLSVRSPLLGRLVKSPRRSPCSSDLRPLISAQVSFVHVVSLTVLFRLIGQPEPDCRHVE